MSHSQRYKLFVTGAGGQLGRRVIEHLLDAGATNLVAGSRNVQALSDLAERGVELRRTDFDDPASLDRAFADVDRLLIISVLDTPDDPPRRLRQHVTGQRPRGLRQFLIENRHALLAATQTS